MDTKHIDDYTSLDRFLGGKPTLSGKTINEATGDDIKDNIHTKAGKIDFIEHITESLKKQMLERVSKMPDEWDGVELRQFMIDKASEYSAGSMDRKRKKSYENTRMVDGL